jgi:hypothetical protein
MYVVVRESILSDEDGFNAAYQEFAAILAQTPGLRGYIRLDAGEGRQVQIGVWESAAAALPRARTARQSSTLRPSTYQPPPTGITPCMRQHRAGSCRNVPTTARVKAATRRLRRVPP